MRNILVFGDSITWGKVPTAPFLPSTRYKKEDRWPEVMATTLGAEYNVILEGLQARTTNIDDPRFPGLLNGAEYLGPALMSHEPLDLVVIMLGTNDVTIPLGRTAHEIGLGMGELINKVQEVSSLGWTIYERPHVLIISPPPLGDNIDPSLVDFVTEVLDTATHEKLAALPTIYSNVAEAAGADFFDAATVVEPDEVGIDGIHLLVEGNRGLGLAVAAKVAEILE
jgi:lysophospholipase L1-like esterase